MKKKNIVTLLGTGAIASAVAYSAVKRSKEKKVDKKRSISITAEDKENEPLSNSEESTEGYDADKFRDDFKKESSDSVAKLIVRDIKLTAKDISKSIKKNFSNIRRN